MLDLHCHLLPGIDDGAEDLPMALELARMAHANGIRTIACTPHIYPGVYENTAAGIREAVADLQAHLDREGIELRLVVGADVHLDSGLLGGLQAGRVPTLADSRYLLLEPPHHSAPPRFADSVFDLMVAGYVPVITHPERLRWIEDHYDVFRQLVGQGAWMQLTAGAVAGLYGKRPLYWAERMLGEGLVHILATDAHHPRRRPPTLAEGREAAARHVGEEEAMHMVATRPQGIIDNVAPEDLPPLPRRRVEDSRTRGVGRLLGRFFRGAT